MKFCDLVPKLHLPQNFCHTGRHFPKIIKLCSEHLRACKSIKNQMLKIFSKPMLSFIYIEERKIVNVK